MSYTSKAAQFASNSNSNNQHNTSEQDMPVKDHNNICSSRSTSSNSNSSRSSSSVKNATNDTKKLTQNLAETYPSINHHHHHHHHHPSHLIANRYPALSLNTPGTGCIYDQPLYSAQSMANSYMVI